MDRRRAGAKDGSPTERTVGAERRTSICQDVRSVFSFSPKGPQASILLPQSTQPHTRPSCMVSMMDGADAPVASNMEKNNAGFIQTEVSVISVSTKQMSLTLERSKNRFTTT